MPQITVRRTADGRLTASGDPVCALGHRFAERHGSGGIYANWIWSGSELTLEADRYGMFPLFVSIAANRCTVASDLTLLLDAGAPSALDYDALSVFLRLGFFVGGDTSFSSISVLPPAAALRWEASGPQITCGHSIPVTIHDVTRDDAIDEFIARVDRAIASRLSRAPFTVPLGGDCESRHILFALVAARCAPEACVSVDDSRSQSDVAVAAAVCARLGIPHIKIAQLQDRRRLEREKNRRTHFCADEHAELIALADYLRDVTAVTYDGLGGDLAQRSQVGPDDEALRTRDEAALAAHLLDSGGTAVSEDALAQLLSPDMLREVPRERALARLTCEISRHVDAPNPLSSFFFWNRTRRELALAPYALMRDVTVYSPYLDADVFDLLAGLPPAILSDGAFHADAIARAYPRLANVPYEPKYHRSERHAWQRRLASDLIHDMLHAPALRAGALRPSAVATLVDGDADRLWYAPLAVYLAQLGVLANRERSIRRTSFDAR